MTTLRNNTNRAFQGTASQPQTAGQKSYLSKVAKGIENYFAKSKRKAAVRSALIAIEKRHPDWVDAGFDEHFVANQGAAIFADYFDSGQLPDAAALVEAWSVQYTWSSMRKPEVQRRLLPVAQDFVYILSTASV